MGKTLGDRAKDLYKNYIAPTKEDLEKGAKELRLTAPERYGSGTKKYEGSIFRKHRKLTPEEQRKTAEQAPLMMKGIRKKCMDGTRAWFNIETLPDRGTVIESDLVILHAFEKRSNFKAKWNQIKVDSHIYGDGYLLITFENDETTNLWQKPSDGSYPWKVEVLDSECINEIDYYPKMKKVFQPLKVMHYHFKNTKNRKDFWIHPDRIIHMSKDRLAYHQFGNSTPDLLRNVIRSKMNIDIAAGEILAWFAHGIYDIAIPGCDENDVDYWEKKAAQHPGAWIHGDEEKITAVNPVAINPKPFYDYVVMNIAAALIMPTHLLTGIQVGRTTGAEIGFGDYYKDVKDTQELVDTPLIEDLYARILKGHGKTWKYELIWNPIYIDELAEAEIMLKRTQAADLALNGTKGVGGFADEGEARAMYNGGQIKLDENKKIKPRVPPLPAPKPPQPDIKKEIPVKELTGKKADEADAQRLGISLDDYYEQKKNLYQFQLNAATRAMIEKRKEIVAREKALGEKILKEQDEDV